MGCFFGCFRIRDDGRHGTRIVSKSIASKPRDHLVSKNQLASVFLCEEKGSPCEKATRLSSEENADKDSELRELKNEAKLLKSCGAILDTPVELRKAPEKKISQTLDEDRVSSSSGSRLTGTSLKKLLWDEQLDQPSVSPRRVHENSSAPENITVCNKSKGYDDSALPLVSSSKSVRFEDVNDSSGFESKPSSICLDTSPFQTEIQIQPVGSKHSPYPTPLKLTDEMLTPGTVYPAKLDNLATGRNARIRTQYVFPVSNPVENSAQWRMLREGSHQCDQSSDFFEQESNENCGEKESTLNPNEKGNDDTQSTCKDKHVSSGSIKEEVSLNSDSPQLVVSSLSQWLKPPTANNERKRYDEANTKDRSHSGKSSDVERPIIGMVAAHWMDNEHSRVSPKRWSGNGIPNSTNKYKEDQKVSWHATPFEERLEKALSEEKLFPQRNLLDGKPIEFTGEREEDDTAAS